MRRYRSRVGRWPAFPACLPAYNVERKRMATIIPVRLRALQLVGRQSERDQLDLLLRSVRGGKAGWSSCAAIRVWARRRCSSMSGTGVGLSPGSCGGCRVGDGTRVRRSPSAAGADAGRVRPPAGSAARCAAHGVRFEWRAGTRSVLRRPDGWPRSGSTVQFVTDGIESAVARAKSAADPKSVGVHGAQTIQQCLDAGVLDEIHIDFQCCGFVDLLRGRHEWGEMTRRGLELPAEAPPPERQARA
jgi:hypothetical protein